MTCRGVTARRGCVGGSVCGGGIMVSIGSVVCVCS